jgi:hypothetical protein
MDLVITYSDSPTLLADVTITHPVPANTTQITQPMQLPLYFAKYREGSKVRRYGEAIRQMHHTFAPLVLETFGAAGPALTKYIKHLASRQHQLSTNCPENDITARSTLVRYWRTRIACGLQKANARLIISKSNRIKANQRQGTNPNAPDLTEPWTIS